MIDPGLHADPQPEGAFTTLDGEDFYRISAFDRMPPFLMSIPSDGDLWMFVSSASGLTAGRVDPDGSLFPYETVDRLHDAHHHTGPFTLLRVRRVDARPALWQPFSERGAGEFRVERNLYKNTVGNRLVFEEVNHDLGLVFRQRWAASDEFGWIRTVTLENTGATRAAVAVLDGLRNVLPHGAPLALYQQSSSLVDAYKRTDLDAETGLAIFSLTSRIIDRPEAAEQLRANVAWCHGLPGATAHLSLDAITAFRRGAPLPAERVRTGQRGHYLVAASLALEPRAVARWHVAADAGLGHVQAAALRARLAGGEDLGAAIDASLEQARTNLLRHVASADGLQQTAQPATDAHHFANVLFNTMRGGVFAANHDVPADEFRALVATCNVAVARRQAAFLAALPAQVPVRELVARAAATGDADLERLAREALPLHFGRRHGDPSRPWNRFRIQVRNDDGTRALRYEGNWRDIFQNWEALGVAFPDFLPGMVARFVDASTLDGFNPYRILRDGIDWEVVDPQHPWSGIGYWGDHQVVYLLRLLEAAERAAPGELAQLVDRAIFTYADVPYRLAPYEAIVDDPRATITFETEHAARIDERVRALGADGRLVPGEGGGIAHVTLAEKLLVPALSKLSNFVPDGGIWMNTQRPEWNDANNALVGDGLSVVTVCHLRRYLAFVERLFAARGDAPATVSGEVVRWFRRVRDVLASHHGQLVQPALDDGGRRHVLDSLGRAFSLYREAIRRDGLRGTEELPSAEIVALCRVAGDWLDHAIRANRRADGLYHAYNLLALSPGAAAIRRLDVMLEGQVAALSSGLVPPAEAVEMLEQLFASPLHRADQDSFLLYPERALPGFLEKNAIPDARARAVPLLAALAAAGDTSLVARDVTGTWRFHADFANARDVAAALDRLAARPEWAAPVAADRAAVLDAFEEVFHHRSFTGRSGTMYGYEGLGCIYWHMVAKLLVAVQELFERAVDEDAPAAVRDALARAYERVRGGLGFAKTPREYGAFPADPYSHTPRHAGAQQPGMTGQVKEEILTRFGELGVRIEGGRVRFRPALLGRAAFRPRAGTFRCFGLSGEPRELDVPAGALAFTYCQVPVVYELGDDGPSIRVTARDGATTEHPGDELDAATSRALLARSGALARIDVRVPASELRG